MANGIIDASFAGGSVSVAGVTVKDFMDDSNPVEFQASDLSGVGMNFMGKVVKWGKPSLIMMSVTVVPGSSSDTSLRNVCKRYHVGSNQDGKTSADVVTATVSSPSGGTWSLSDGFPVSFPGGPNVSAEGKMQGATYTFAFGSLS